NMEDVEAYQSVGTAQAGSRGSANEGKFALSFAVPDELTDGDDVEDVAGGTNYVYASYDKGGDDIVASAKFYTRGITLDPEEGNVGGQQRVSQKKVFRRERFSSW
ncbi:hypothetical protein ACFLV0_03285, partial [Chloroflexota bacterium]